jgi:hypothetical protein
MNRSFPGSAALLLAAIAIVTCVQTGFAQFGTGAPAPEEANRPRLIGLRPVSNETGNNRRLPSAQVEGLVLDGSRKPMKGIEVYVQDSAPLGKTLKAKTDASGRYSIGALTPGNYQSCAVWEGASGLCRELKVQDREQWSSDFVLFGLNGGCPWRGSGYIGTNFDWCGGRPVGFTGGKCSLNSSDRLDSAS